MMYGQNAIAVNEFLGKSWSHIPPNSNESLGVTFMKSRGLFPQAYWYWIGVGATIGYVFLFNFLFTVALKYLDAFRKPQSVLSEEALAEKTASKTGDSVELSSREKSFERGSESRRSTVSSRTLSARVGSFSEASQTRKRGMIHPFEPHFFISPLGKRGMYSDSGKRGMYSDFGRNLKLHDDPELKGKSEKQP